MKKTVLAAAALSLALSLGGCSSGLTILSNYRRIENIELVRTVAADKEADGVNVAVCGTAGEESSARMYENTGKSLGAALGELALLPLGRDAVLSHTENMLIGEELARERLGECLDYIERFSEMRLDTGILIVRDGTARDLLHGLTGEDTPAPDVIAGLSRNIARVGDGYFFTCREIASSLADNGCALVQCVRAQKEEKLFEARGDLNIAPAGFAVVREGGGLDFLSDEETLGAMLLLRKYKSRIVDLPLPEGALTVSVDSAAASIRPRFERDGALDRVEIRLELEANVISVSGEADLEDRTVREAAEAELSRLFRRAAESAVARSQALGLDYLDLESIIHRREPLKAAPALKNWADTFPGLPVEVEAESTLQRTYDIVDPPEDAKEGEDPWEKMIRLLRGS